MTISAPAPHAADRIFNKDHARAHRRRAAAYAADGADFLLRRAERSIIDRLGDIKRDFPNILLLVPHDVPDLEKILTARGATIEIINDAALSNDEQLRPSRPAYDLIISLFELHHLNDPVGWLIQMRRHLVEDGALIAGFIGGETLHQLRQCLLESELTLTGGASPRVFPFMDRQQLAGLMQRAGYALPVVDAETITVSYRDIFHLMSDLRAMGATNSLSSSRKTLARPQLFYDAGERYKAQFSTPDGRIDASFEMLFAIGWSPSTSQPQPLRRGTGQVSLADVLK